MFHRVRAKKGFTAGAKFRDKRLESFYSCFTTGIGRCLGKVVALVS